MFYIIPGIIQQSAIQGIKSFPSFLLSSIKGLVGVLGLLTLVNVWYGCAAFDMIDLFNTTLSRPHMILHDRISLCRQQRELPNDFFSLVSDSNIIGEAMNLHRKPQSFDLVFIANLISNHGLNNNLFEIILHTGCTFAISPFRADFVHYTAGTFGNINTVSRPTSVIGFGHVEWTVMSENGKETPILVPCHHVPSATVHLLSPQDNALFHGFHRSRDQFAGNSSYFWMKLSGKELLPMSY
jgi:hypothetical protein